MVRILIITFLVIATGFITEAKATMDWEVKNLRIVSPQVTSCQNIEYIMEYSTRCIDGYEWMMRIDRTVDCTIYLSPVSQIFDLKKGKIVPRLCSPK